MPLDEDHDNMLVVQEVGAHLVEGVGPLRDQKVHLGLGTELGVVVDYCLTMGAALYLWQELSAAITHANAKYLGEGNEDA
jgi:hypothetical protein